MDITVLDIFEKSCHEYQNKTLFKDQFSSVSYVEAQRLSKSIATSLLQKVNVKNNPIVVFIDRNIESLITFLGITYSGNFYAPIDINQPKERVEKILNKLQPSILINATKKEKLDYGNDKCPLFNYKELLDIKIDEKLLNQVRESMIDTDPLYAIFTSGSTGTPKGVLIKQYAVLDMVNQFKKEFHFDENNIFGNQAPFDFDVSVKDIYSTLLNGATLIVIPKVCFMFPTKLIEYINENKINTAIWATSVFRIVENVKGLEKDKMQTLKLAMFSGEVMPTKVLNYWRKNQPDIQYVNLYGPTEITCNCTFYKVEKEFDDKDTLPIGKAFRNTEILLLDNEDKLITEANIQGEICVRGSSLALGYYNDPEITAKAFVQNPLNKSYEEKIYRTGDLAEYNELGELIFIGRKDHQIKHMGHRIELAEIEKLANSVDFINASVCVYNEEREKIVMFYESKEDDNKKVYLTLKELLPKYMIPNEMIWYEKLPVTKNSKIDRVKLKGIHCGA
ncbi:amino acid adenylation domain-containing protein [Helcococcus kunzii]|uniref:Amino acid adenylation domain-containing protein n=1 Tax=Helcococcus kunzii ATCC 51366 TaxID=883114 RepID=H3NQD6_9FIRM|nr:amino acid adenylation domain-containing protein [Helcococcus kunzii]EHR32616.1 amino acid adenylation domain-containing protein [Helcococcus kunzii ATCC 51366]QUY65404.1 amino acid adenylation domain-containing protein [Helcococcus kunzii]QZO76078.1 amino acid adenylation domain-containing protein [Helcococcus kunzii]